MGWAGEGKGLRVFNVVGIEFAPDFHYHPASATKASPQGNASTRGSYHYQVPKQPMDGQGFSPTWYILQHYMNLKAFKAIRTLFTLYLRNMAIMLTPIAPLIWGAITLTPSIWGLIWGGGDWLSRAAIMSLAISSVTISMIAILHMATVRATSTYTRSSHGVLCCVCRMLNLIHVIYVKIQYEMFNNTWSREWLSKKHVFWL